MIGQSVEITLLDGDVFVDRSRVVKADNAAANGYAPSPLLRCMAATEIVAHVVIRALRCQCCTYH